MTTNKPEVVYANYLYKSAAIARCMQGTAERTEPVVRLSDYEALQAELKKAVAALTDARFTRCDGPAGWRPPLGNPAGPLIDRIDTLEAERETLREALDMCTRSMGSVLPDFNPFDQAAYDKACAALAKARGES